MLIWYVNSKKRCFQISFLERDSGHETSSPQTKRHVKKGTQEMTQKDPSTPKQNYYYAPSPIHVSAVALVDPETGSLLFLSVSSKYSPFITVRRITIK
jgi:hypothetical protein